MKLVSLSAASGLALCAFIGAANAQAATERLDANGMPTTHSTPAEQAQTANLNNQVAQGNAAVDAQAAANNANYQSQQQQYQNQVEQNSAQQQQYRQQSAQYEALRMRYAAERAAYHRGVWPGRYGSWVVVREDRLIGNRVQLITGSRVGTVRDIALRPNGTVSGLLVELDGGKVVWVDSGDVRYNRADGIIMTNLDRQDLMHMADQRL